MNFIQIERGSVVNGHGIRVVVWLTGCEHRCDGCYNKQTWNPNIGEEVDYSIKEIIFNELAEEYIDGITFTGGDPLYRQNRNDLRLLIKEIKELFPQKDIWLYTGYTWEEIVSDKEKLSIVSLCDVIIDGEYEENLHDITLKFRGSSNQRVIDVQKSLADNKIVLYCD